MGTAAELSKITHDQVVAVMRSAEWSAILRNAVDARLVYWLPRLAGLLRWGSGNAAFNADNAGTLIDGKGVEGALKDAIASAAATPVDVHALADAIVADVPPTVANELLAALGAAITKGVTA
jgi:hypothetical protein